MSASGKHEAVFVPCPHRVPPPPPHVHPLLFPPPLPGPPSSSIWSRHHPLSSSPTRLLLLLLPSSKCFLPPRLPTSSSSCCCCSSSTRCCHEGENKCPFLGRVSKTVYIFFQSSRFICLVPWINCWGVAETWAWWRNVCSFLSKLTTVGSTSHVEYYSSEVTPSTLMGVCPKMTYSRHKIWRSGPIEPDSFTSLLLLLVVIKWKSHIQAYRSLQKHQWAFLKRWVVFVFG